MVLSVKTIALTITTYYPNAVSIPSSVSIYSSWLPESQLQFVSRLSGAQQGGGSCFFDHVFERTVNCDNKRPVYFYSCLLQKGGPSPMTWEGSIPARGAFWGELPSRRRGVECSARLGVSLSCPPLPNRLPPFRCGSLLSPGISFLFTPPCLQSKKSKTMDYGSWEVVTSRKSSGRGVGNCQGLCRPKFSPPKFPRDHVQLKLSGETFWGGG